MEIRKISPESEEYSQIIEERQEKNIENRIRGEIFGLDTIEQVDKIKEEGDTPEEINKILEDSRQQILNLLESQEFDRFFAILKMFADPSIKNNDFLQELSKHPDYSKIFNCYQFGGQEGEAREAREQLGGKRGESEGRELEVAFLECMPVNLYEKVLRLHVEDYRTFERLCPEIIADFIKKIEEKIINGEIPITIELVKKRIGETDFVFTDATNPNEKDYEVGGGIYIPQKGRIVVTGVESLTHTIDHEIFHLLSGRTPIIEKSEDASEIDKAEMEHMRIGFHFGFPDAKIAHTKGTRFFWLNEAVTDILANELQGTKETAYPSELLLNNKFINGGRKKIERSTLLNAYFENYDPEQGIPAWKLFMEEVSQAYEPGFLVELDNKYRTSISGADSALGYILAWQNKNLGNS